VPNAVVSFTQSNHGHKVDGYYAVAIKMLLTFFKSSLLFTSIVKYRRAQAWAFWGGGHAYLSAVATIGHRSIAVYAR
jgi:hypothetical protein